MTGPAFLETLGIMVVAAAAAAWLGRAVGVPSIVAYLGAGLLLAPFLGLPPGAGEGAGASAVIGHFGHFGIALLLFLAGLELSLDKIRAVGRVAVIGGLGQVAATAVGGIGLAWLLGYDLRASVVLGVALTFSSTVVVVKLLEQKHELDTLYGRIAVGIFLVQDLVVIVILTILAGLQGEGPLTAGALAAGLGRAFGGMALLLLAALLAARWLLPRAFAWVAGAAPALLIWSLSACLLFVIAAKAMGLSAEIGAFVAGVSLAQLSSSPDLRRRVHPLMNFFIAVLFVSLGLQLDLSAAMGQLPTVAILSLFVLIGNPVIFIALIAWCGYSERTAFLAGVTVAQISEFSFVFASLCVGAGFVGPDVLSVIGLVGIVTIGVSAAMIVYNEPLYRFCRERGWLRPFRAAASPAEPDEAAPLSGHVVVVGMNALGRRLAAALHARGDRVLAVDTDPNKLAALPCATLMGSATSASVMAEAGLARARLVVSALHIQDANEVLVFRCRRLGVPIAAFAYEAAGLDALRAFGASPVVDAEAAAEAALAERLLGEGRPA